MPAHLPRATKSIPFGKYLSSARFIHTSMGNAWVLPKPKSKAQDATFKPTPLILHISETHSSKESHSKRCFSDTSPPVICLHASIMYLARKPVLSAKIAASPASARAAGVGNAPFSPKLSHSAAMIFLILGMLLF